MSEQKTAAQECGGISLAVSTNPRAHCKQCSGQSLEKQPPALLLLNFRAVQLITPNFRQPPVVPYQYFLAWKMCWFPGISGFWSWLGCWSVAKNLCCLGERKASKKNPQKTQQAKFCVWTFLFILEKAWCCQTQGREGLFLPRLRILLCISRVLLQHL